MRLFREPQPPIEKVPGAAESMGERIARASRQAPVSPFRGKGMVMAVIGLIAVGGVVVTTMTGESKITEGVRRRHEAAEREAAEDAKARQPVAPTPSGPERRPAATDKPAPSSGPLAVPAPRPVDQGPDLAGLAAAAALASPEQRGAARMGALQVYGAFIDTPRTRRTVLIDAARLAPDMTPEEEPFFAQITKGAHEKALQSSDAAGAAVLYLGSLRDRGGPDAVLALEDLVLDEERTLELRVAAARALPDDARLRAGRVLAKRLGAHPVLKTALR